MIHPSANNPIFHIMASKGFTINRTDHFGITVKSISQSLLFWEGLLGGQVLSIQHMEMSPQLNIVGLTDAVIDAATIELADGTRIELLEYSAPADRKVFKPRGCEWVHRTAVVCLY